MSKRREPPDLSGVAPQRRPEMLRRIGIVLDFLEKRSAGSVDPAPFAAALGLNERSFGALVQAWNVHGRASALPGARIAATTPQRLRPRVPAAVDRAIDDLIGELGTELTPAELNRHVRRRLHENGLPSVSHVTVARRLYRARANAEAPRIGDRGQDCESVAVDHSAVAISVTGESGPQLAVASMAFSRRSGFIYAFQLSTAPPSPQVTAATIADMLSIEPPAGAEAELVLAVDRTPGWRALLDAVKDAGVRRSGPASRPPSVGMFIREAMGEGIAGVRCRRWLTYRPWDAAPPSGHLSRPLSLAEAHDAFAEAVAKHNAVRLEAPRPPLANARAERRLISDLGRIAADPPDPPRHRRKV